MTGNGSTSEPVGRAVGLGNVFRHCLVTVFWKADKVMRRP